jgi:putative ABC transport system permease protein
LIAELGGWPAIIQIKSVFLSFGFAAAVGVFFGFYPARKAARLDPIEALRYE